MSPMPAPEHRFCCRRERNRRTALESYYRKKARMAELQAQIDAVEAENRKLGMLLGKLEAGDPAAGKQWPGSGHLCAG